MKHIITLASCVMLSFSFVCVLAELPKILEDEIPSYCTVHITQTDKPQTFMGKNDYLVIRYAEILPSLVQGALCYVAFLPLTDEIDVLERQFLGECSQVHHLLMHVAEGVQLWYIGVPYLFAEIGKMRNSHKQAIMHTQENEIPPPVLQFLTKTRFNFDISIVGGSLNMSSNLCEYTYKIKIRMSLHLDVLQTFGIRNDTSSILRNGTGLTTKQNFIWNF